MEIRPFKPFGSVSALTLGGGGLGQVWGETTRDEAVATTRLAAEQGVTHFDMAPMSVSYTHLRAHETDSYLVCRLLLEKKKRNQRKNLKFI